MDSFEKAIFVLILCFIFLIALHMVLKTIDSVNENKLTLEMAKEGYTQTLLPGSSTPIWILEGGY